MVSHYPDNYDYMEGLDFSTEKIQAQVKELKNEEIAMLGLFFEENVKSSQDLIMLPFLVACVGARKTVAASARAVCEIEALNKLNSGGARATKEDIDKIVAQVVGNLSKNDDAIDAFTRQAYSDMVQALNDNKSKKERDSVYRLFSAATIASWTAFECLAADLWVEAMNSCPSKFAPLAASKIDMPQLVRNKFEVSNVMGTILASSFDFTGVMGIVAAYKTIFEHFEPDFYKDNKTLKTLEKKRHILVHRLGRVDEKFNADTNQKLPIGSLIKCELGDLITDINVVIDSGCKLLRTVDAYVTAATQT